MRARPDRRRSLRSHPLDALIERAEAELRRLRAIRHSDLSALAAKDPIKRKKAAAGRKRAWADPKTRAAHCSAISASWTPARRAAQRARMLAMRADKKKNDEMVYLQTLAQRTPEYRERARIRSTEVWAKSKQMTAAARSLKDHLERRVFEGGE